MIDIFLKIIALKISLWKFRKSSYKFHVNNKCVSVADSSLLLSSSPKKKWPQNCDYHKMTKRIIMVLWLSRKSIRQPDLTIYNFFLKCGRKLVILSNNWGDFLVMGSNPILYSLFLYWGQPLTYYPPVWFSPFGQWFFENSERSKTILFRKKRTN